MIVFLAILWALFTEQRHTHGRGAAHPWLAFWLFIHLLNSHCG